MAPLKAFFLALFLAPATLPAALAVQNLGFLSPTDLVTLLVGTGVSTSNISYTGLTYASGAFTGGAGIIGFDQGVLLTTGGAAGVIGPNNQGSFTGTGGSSPGDPDLDIISGATTYDAAVLEFDFIPGNGTLYFNFVFASEEYLEYVGSINDGFAMYVNGVNVALLPDGITPVTINNVNSSVNSAYYINNSPQVVNTQLDGLTVPLNVAASVNIGVVNHIKIAIADAMDHAYDSAVFIQAGSFSAPSPTYTRTISPTIGPSSTITPTPSITQTRTVSATFSLTPTFSASPTVSETRTPTPTPTQSVTFSHSMTSTQSPTPTTSVTFSFSPTVTATPTITLTKTPTPRPLMLKLLPANPAPASTEAWLPYFLSVDADVSIQVWTVAGERVRGWEAGWRLAGYREEQWDLKNEAGTKVGSGIFIYRIRAVSAAGEMEQDFKKCAVSR